MGVKVCKPCSQNNENDEIIFSNRYKKRTDDSVFYNNSKLYNLNTNFTLTESEYNKAKIIIEEKIKEKGEFSKNLNIKEIISSKNPIANEINVSEVIINSNNLQLNDTGWSYLQPVFCISSKPSFVSITESHQVSGIH